MKRYAIYVRIASGIQTSTGVSGLEQQINKLKRFAKKNNLKVTRIFVGYPWGTSIDRKAFGQFLKKNARKEIDGIICLRPDGLGISLIEFYSQVSKNPIKSNDGLP